MQIAYVTLDELNGHEASQLAIDGITVEKCLPVEPLPNGQYHGYVYDLDHFPAELRGRVLQHLSGSPPPAPIAVHSFSLDDGQVAALRRNGVRVHGHLDPAVFEGFRRDMQAAWG